MFPEKTRIISLLFLCLIFSVKGFSQVDLKEEQNQQTLEKGIELLQRYFTEQNAWHVAHPETSENVTGLIHFIEDEPLDSILYDLKESAADTTFKFVYRLPENVSDSLHVPGYYSASEVKNDLEILGLNMQTEFQNKKITVPVALLSNADEKVNLLSPREGIQLFTDSVYVFPDSLQVPDVVPDNQIKTADDFQRIYRLDSLRDVYIEQKRLAYNDSLMTAYQDSVILDYRQQLFDKEYLARKKKLIDSVRVNNYTVLRNYNDSVINAVNDSILNVIQVLSAYADYIDTTKIHLTNLVNNETTFVLSDANQRYARFWLKNEQNDSLSVLLKNLDKRTIQMLIDDGVTFNRFRTKETKAFDFRTLNSSVLGLTNVGKLYDVNTPWQIGGNGNVGFTQTYLENWKKGGKSALALLIVMKGFANYTNANGKIKWENSGEIRDGWIRQGGEEAELQKNDDKFEIISRFGVSAFKKWYYSAELDYETQLFRGYRYPKSENPEPISAFMAPARTFFKVGLDYKPTKDFSLFLSPLTIKNVFVRDTSLIDQTNFGIDADKRSFWEPGLNADVRYRTDLTSDISYETKYKMFINYEAPFSKFDINWENQLEMKVNDHINFRLLVHLIYDDDVLFPIYDEVNGEQVKVGEKPKLQVKELITVGFSYKINRTVTRTKRKH